MFRTLIAGLAIAISSIASAQNIVVIQTVPVQQRQGVITTPTFQLPDIDGEIQAMLVIPTADYEDQANTLYADLFMEDLSLPGGWRLISTNRPSGWKGGRFIDPEDGTVNPAPIVFSVTMTPAVRGKNFRAEFDVPVRMRAGLTLQTLSR